MDFNWFTSPFSAKNTAWVADSVQGQRDENQDNYLVIVPAATAVFLENSQVVTHTSDAWSNGVYRLAVADGMGGHENGREMAEAVIQELLSLPAQGSPEALREQLFILHKKLLTKFTSNHAKKPGSTLIMADIQPSGKMLLANIGDSRAWRWRDQQWQCLSHDQTHDEYDWRDGDLSDDGYQQGANSNQLAQAIGYGSFGLISDELGYKPRQLSRQLRLDLASELPQSKQHHADIKALNLETGDALLLASDGLWSGLGTSTLELPPPDELINPEDLRKYLWDLTKTQSQDNATGVMVWSRRK